MKMLSIHQPLAIHRDIDAGILERSGEILARKLAALIVVENLGTTRSMHRFFEGLHAKTRIHRIRQPPGQDLAGALIPDGHQVEKTAAHRDFASIIHEEY